MARVLWLLALVTAFLVVAVRLAGLPLAVASAADDLRGAAGEGKGEPFDDDALSPVEVDDDAEHGSAPFMPAASVALELPPNGDPGRVGCSAWVEQQPLPSHAPTLERPPRI